MKRLVTLTVVIISLSFFLFIFLQEKKDGYEKEYRIEEYSISIEEYSIEEYSREVIYKIASLRVKETNSPALQRAREKVLKDHVKKVIASFALRLKINDFKSTEISGSIGSEDMKDALKLLVKPFYSFLEKEYEGHLRIMILECPGFEELLWQARVYGLTESSKEEEK